MSIKVTGQIVKWVSNNIGRIKRTAQNESAEAVMAERRVDIDPWVAAGIGLFITFTLAGIFWAAVNGWFGPWLQNLLSTVSGQF